MGDSFSALGFLLLASGLNIVLDLWFVISFGWGVVGVAITTVLSQTISAYLCFLKLKSMKDAFSISRHTLRLHRETVRDILRLGMPVGVTRAIFSMAMHMVQPLQNSFGSEFVATAIIAMRVDSFAMMPIFPSGWL
jgi:Na+-driven multidrug efflux pump